MDSILLERGCSAGGDGEGPNLGSVDALSSVFARMRRSHAEHSQACDTLEGLIAQGNREQQKIKAEIEQIKERLQAKATRDPHQEAVVANLTSSVAMMREQIRVAETEKTRLQEEHEALRQRLDSLHRSYLTRFEQIRTRYAGRLVDNTKLELKLKMSQLAERKSAAASRVSSLEKENKRKGLEDWKKFREIIVVLLKSRKKLGEEWDKKRQQETQIRSLREAIHQKELELTARKEREATLEKEKTTARAKSEQPSPRPQRWLSSLQKVSQQPEVKLTAQTTGKVRRDTPRPNRFDTGLDLLKASKFRKKFHLTVSSGDSRSEDTPDTQSVTEESSDGDRVTSQPGPSSTPAPLLNLGQSPILVGRQASLPVTAKDSRYGASAQSLPPSVPNLVFSSKVKQGHLPTGSILRDGTPSRPCTSYGQDSTSSQEEHRTVASSSHQSFSGYSGHLADVSNTSESTPDQVSVGRSPSCANTPSPSISSGFRPRCSTGSRVPTSTSNFVNELSSITETEVSMDEKNQSSSSEDIWYTPPSPSQLHTKEVRQAYVSSLLNSPEFTFKKAPTPPKLFSQRMGPSESSRQSDMAQSKISSSTAKSHSQQHLGDQAQEYVAGPQPKSTTGELEMEQESGVGESPKCRSNTILTSTPGKTQISKKDYTTEYTTTPECSDLNKAGFLEDMELETEEASGQMMNSLQFQSSQGFIVEADGDADGTRTSGTDQCKSVSFLQADKSFIGSVETSHYASLVSRNDSAVTTAPSSNTSPSEGNTAFTHSSPSSTAEVHKDLLTFSMCVDTSSSSASSRHPKPTSPGSSFNFMLGESSDSGRGTPGALRLFGSPEDADGFDNTSEESSGVNFSLFGDSQPSQESDSGGSYFNFGFGGTRGSPSTHSSPGSFISSFYDSSSFSSSSRSSEREGGGAGFRLF
ncbi:serine-rich adhesin for platelets isoform X4 [Penaeus vannamei]|uniref:serine-rich adhesin for platelets isoform X4 n=1 Tax=Penaeus vannamei TaxID=6689 RepID=UPI00387F5111